MLEDSQFGDLLGQSFGRTLRDLDVSTVYAGWGISGWSDPTRALVTVVSPDFEGVDAGHCQELVWEEVLPDLSEKERAQIEFIFTEDPSELGEHDPRRKPTQAVGMDPSGRSS